MIPILCHCASKQIYRFCLVLEFMNGGTLHNVLRKAPETINFYSMATQVDEKILKSTNCLISDAPSFACPDRNLSA